MTRLRLADIAKGTFSSSYSRVSTCGFRKRAIYPALRADCLLGMRTARAVGGHGGMRFLRYVANNPEIDGTAGDRPRADRRRVASVRAAPAPRLPSLLGHPRHATAAAGRRSGPACRELGVDHWRAYPLTRRGLVQLQTGQLPAYPSNLSHSAPAARGTLTATLSEPRPALRPTRQG